MSNIISVVSLIISLVAIVFTVINYRQSKKDSFQTLSVFLIEQKTSFLSNLQRAGEVEEDEIQEYLKRELAANYCNAFEHACGLYLNKGIDRKLFKKVFQDEVLSLERGDGIAAYVNMKSVDESRIYENIRKVGSEFKK